jgi:hypothetical protein
MKGGVRKTPVQVPGGSSVRTPASHRADQLPFPITEKERPLRTLKSLITVTVVVAALGLPMAGWGATICFIGDCSTTGTTETVNLVSVNKKTGALTVSLNGATTTLTANTTTTWRFADLNQAPPQPIFDAWVEWNTELSEPFSLAGMLHAASDLAAVHGNVAITSNDGLTIATIQPCEGKC